MVIKAHPVIQHVAGALWGFEAMPMYPLFFTHTDDPLHHAVLSRAVQRNEPLAQAVAPTSLQYRDLAPDDLQDQYTFTLGRPAFAVFFHLRAHRQLPEL